MDDNKLKNKKEEIIGDADDIDKKRIEEKDGQSSQNGSEDRRDEKIFELEENLKRAVADYRNLERRSVEERVDAIKFGNKHLIEALLPAFDTLFLAGKFTTDESVKLTVKRILEILKENGIEIVVTSNAKYNAETMEVVEVIEGNEGMVLEEIRPGFVIYGKLIRPAQVKVGKGK